MQELRRMLANPIFFVVSYLIFMLATYILPYGGSNSALVQGIASATKVPDVAHFKILFWLHLGSIMALCCLSWIRGSCVNKSWITIFPILAGFFDLIPGLSLIPLIPTVLHMCALVMGARGGKAAAPSDALNEAIASSEKKTQIINPVPARPSIPERVQETPLAVPPQRVPELINPEPTLISPSIQTISKDISQQLVHQNQAPYPNYKNNSFPFLAISIFALASVIAVVAAIYFLRPALSSQLISTSPVEKAPQIDEHLPISRRSGEYTPKVQPPKIVTPQNYTIFPMPNVKIGDTYEYETLYGESGKKPTTVFRRISEKTDNQLVLEITNQGADTYSRKSYYDREWNLIRTESKDGRQEFSPPLKYFSFPLFTGKTWSSESVEILFPSQKRREHKVSAEVRGEELIDVPAGRYKTVRVVTKALITDGENTSETTDTSWYCHEIGRSVKTELMTRNITTGKVESRTVRLSSFLQPTVN